MVYGWTKVFSNPSGHRPANDGFGCTQGLAGGWFDPGADGGCWLGNHVSDSENPSEFKWQLQFTLEAGQEKCAHLDAIYAVDDTGGFTLNGGKRVTNPGTKHYEKPTVVPDVYGNGFVAGANTIVMDLENSIVNQPGPWGIFVRGSVCFSCHPPSAPPPPLAPAEPTEPLPCDHCVYTALVSALADVKVQNQQLQG